MHNIKNKKTVISIIANIVLILLLSYFIYQSFQYRKQYKNILYYNLAICHLMQDDKGAINKKNIIEKFKKFNLERLNITTIIKREEHSEYIYPDTKEGKQFMSNRKIGKAFYGIKKMEKIETEQ